MFSEKRGYSALRLEATIGGSAHSIPQERRQNQVKQRSSLKIVVVGALLLSIAFNIINATKHFQPRNIYTTTTHSPYARLKRDILIPWSWKSQREGNETKDAQLWEETALDKGVVALDDAYTESMGLPLGQRFPWDRKKSIYVVNGYHNLHCLTIMRQAFMKYARGEDPEKGAYHHVQHCLESLRQDVICDADDTPRFAGFEKGVSGDEQFRQCRDWSQLESWSKEHTACYRFDHGAKHSDKLWHYSFCPPESPYFAASQKALDDM